MKASVIKCLMMGFLLMVTAPLAAESHESAKQADARALLNNAQRAVGQVVRAAQGETSHAAPGSGTAS